MAFKHCYKCTARESFLGCLKLKNFQNFVIVGGAPHKNPKIINLKQPFKNSLSLPIYSRLSIYYSTSPNQLSS